MGKISFSAHTAANTDGLGRAIGADLHIPFPIAARASFGYWLSYFCVISRGILALFWFGIQSAYGGQCATIMITAIWPSFAHLKNQLPASAGITTQGMISYFIYCIVQFPFLIVPTHKLQYLFYAKTVLVLPTAIAMIVWITVKAGHQSGDFFNQPPEVHGSERAWLWVSALTSTTGAYSTLAVNIMDFSRFSKHPGAQTWQLPTIPLFKCVVAAFGVLGAAASKEVYGTVLWSPLDIIMKWQGSPGGRAAAFFAASVWFLAQISCNISANSIAFGNGTSIMVHNPDVQNTELAFRYHSNGSSMVQHPQGRCVRCGHRRMGNVSYRMTLCQKALLSVLIDDRCPWIIIKSAATLLSFLSAYAVFMAPMAGILFCDYWLVKRKRYDVPALYDPQGIYYYKVSDHLFARQPLTRLTCAARRKLASSAHDPVGHRPALARHGGQDLIRQREHQPRPPASLRLQLALRLRAVGRGILDAESDISCETNADTRGRFRHSHDC